MFKLYVQFIVVYGKILSYVFFILSCTTLQFGFLCIHSTMVLYVFFILYFTTLQFRFVCSHSKIVLYVLFILSCTMLQFGFLFSIFGLFCCSDKNTPHPCSTNAIGGIHRFLPPLNIQWWLSCSSRPPSSVDPPAMSCPHRVHPADQY